MFTPLLQHSVFLLSSLTVWPITRANVLKSRYTKYVSNKPWIRLCASCHHHPPANNLSNTSHKIRLSVSASPLFPYRIRLSVSASPPPIGSQQNVPMVAHSAPRFPTSNRSTQRHYERITTHPQQSANTNQPHRSHTLNFPHSARVSWLVIPLPHCFYTPIW